MPPAVGQAFAMQEEACAALGSPFTARLARLARERMVADNDVAVRILGWRGDPSPFADSVPLRLAGALHALVLSGRDPALAAVYPPHSDGASDDAFWRAIHVSMSGHGPFLLEWLASPPQTNEVRRSAGIYAGLSLVAERSEIAGLRVLELGASAGLNLACDRYAYRFDGRDYGEPASRVRLDPQWRGGEPPSASFVIEARAGCDLHPLDVHRTEDLLRLRAYTWADQADRLARLDAAVSIARNRLPPGAVVGSDAGEWLEEVLRHPVPGAATAIFHTIAWQYFSPATAARCEAAIRAAAANASREAPLAWLAIEADGSSGAAMRLRMWPAGSDRLIGRMDFHGRWIEWLS